MDTIIISKKDGENSVSLHRRFSKRFRSSGIQVFTKQNRFHARKISKNIRKKDCITRLRKREKFNLAYRLGKLEPWKKRR